MTLFELQQEHSEITKAYYEDKTLEKDAFERLHLINALRQCIISNAEQTRKDGAQAKLNELLG